MHKNTLNIYPFAQSVASNSICVGLKLPTRLYKTIRDSNRDPTNREEKVK